MPSSSATGSARSGWARSAAARAASSPGCGSGCPARPSRATRSRRRRTSSAAGARRRASRSASPTSVPRTPRSRSTCCSASTWSSTSRTASASSGLSGGGRPYTVFHIPLEIFALSAVYRGFLLSQWRESGHVHFLTRDLALALLTDCGYDVVDACYTPGYTLPHAYGWKDSLANVARRLVYPVAPDLAVRLFGGFSLLVLAR